MQIERKKINNKILVSDLQSLSTVPYRIFSGFFLPFLVGTGAVFGTAFNIKLQLRLRNTGDMFSVTVADPDTT